MNEEQIEQLLQMLLNYKEYLKSEYDYKKGAVA